MRVFASPPAGFAPLLTWNWNGRLEEKALRETIIGAAAAGFGGLITRVGFGASPAYLSDEWLRMLRLCARECRRNALELWIGDEGPGRAGTPIADGSGGGRSGTRAGRIGREWPELRSHYLRFHSDDIALGQSAAYRLPGTTGTLLYAIAAPLVPATRKLDFSRSIELTAVAAERVPILIERIKADVRVLTFSQERAGYIDLLNPHAAYSFLQTTHERIRDALGDDWPAVSGFWVQSPTLRDKGAEASEVSDGLQRLPWSPLLQDSFSQRPGYELLEWLPALVADLGDDSSRLRQDFWQEISRMAQEGFWEPLAIWAHGNGVEYAGAPAGTDLLNGMVSQQADVALTYRALSRPTIESPALSTPGSLDLGRHLRARLAASVAALASAPGQTSRVMAEVGRGAGWDATLSDRIATGHHLLRQGINGFAVNGTQLHGRDDTPFPQPPDELRQPYAARWPAFATYLSRCSYLMSRGRPGARVGLLWPIRSAHAHYHPKGHRLTRWVEEDLYATALMLDDLHFSFLFVEENDLLEAPFENGKVLCGAARHPFDLIVLPSVTTLPRALWDKLESFVEAGGKVACLGLLPRYSERGRDHQFEERISKATMVTVADLYEAYSEMENSGGNASPIAGFPITKESANGGRLSCYQPRLNDDVGEALLSVRKILKESLTPELETQTTDLLYASRVLDDDESPLDWGEIVVPELEETEIAPLEEIAPPPIEPIAEAEDDGFSWDRPFDWQESEASEPLQSTLSTPTEAEAAPQSTLESELEGEDDETSPQSTLDEENESLPRLNLPETLPEAPSASGGDLYFIFNAGEEVQRANVRLRPTQDGVPHWLDAWSGEVRRAALWTQFPEIEGGGISLSLDLAPHEAKWLWVQPAITGSDAEAAHVEATTWTVEAFHGGVASGYATEGGVPRLAIRQGGRLHRLSGEEVTIPPALLFPDSWQSARSGPNVMRPAEWQWQRGRHLPGDQRRIFGRDIWQNLARAGALTPRERGAWEQQSRLELSGIITFRSHFEIAEAPCDLWLPFEPLDVPRDVYLNGELLETGTPEWSEDTTQGANAPWNHGDLEWFNLSEFAVAGENILSVVADCREKSTAEGGSAPDEEPFMARVPSRPRLVGDFSLTPDGALLPPQAFTQSAGSWHEQNLPFYSGALDYRQWIKVPLDWNRCRIFLEVSRTRDACGLWLNGRFVGERVTAPYRFDVSKWLLKGASNEIRLRVWNTAQAARDLPDRPAPSGLLGPVRLVAYPLVYQSLDATRPSI